MSNNVRKLASQYDDEQENDLERGVERIPS